MKISKKEKDRVRRELIASAVDVISELGIQNSTMRKIAKSAGVGDSTIYKYFPNKNSFFYAYFEQTIKDVGQSLQKVDEFEEYSLQEKLQSFTEAILENYTGNREFVETGFQVVFNSPLSSYSEIIKITNAFTKIVQQFIDAAIEDEEIPALPFQTVISAVMADFFIGVLLFWLKDHSENHSYTSQVIDMSLDIVVILLKSNLIPKVIDLFIFFIRKHLFSWSERYSNSAQSFDKVKSLLSKIKKSIKEGHDES